MNWAFKVIQGHRYWRWHKSTTGCCHNVQQRRPYFRKLAVASGKLQIRRDFSHHIPVYLRNGFDCLEILCIARN